MPIQALTLEEITSLIKPAASRGIQEIVLHHSWSPTTQQYRGLATWEAIRNYHMTERGWSDIGYHFGVGPDGSLWELRDYRKSGAHVLNRNQHTIGICMIGNFDSEDPTRSLAAAAHIVRVLLKRFGLTTSAIRFHSEFQDKTCPGTRVSLAAFRKEVAGTATPATPPKPAKTVAVKIIDHLTGKVVQTLQMVPEGDHVGDQGKLYVRVTPV